MERDAEVVIVGGGIIGCASAYYLAKRGVDVVLLEKGEVAYEQSSRNWGWVHQQVRYPHLIPLAVMSAGIWNSVEEELGETVEWVRGGNLSLGFDAEDIADFESWQTPARERGLETELLTREQVAAMVPSMAGGWVGAIHVPSDGQANPERATKAFASAAAARGARIYTSTAVEGIERTAGRVSAVATERGSIATSHVVCAAGSWSARLARPLGLRLPQRSVRSTVVRTTPTEPVTGLTAWGDRVTFRQDREGRFVLAGGGGAVYDVTLDALRDFKHFLPAAWQNRRWLSLRIGRPLARDLRTLVPGTSARRHPWSVVRAVDPPPHRKTAENAFRRFIDLFPSLSDLSIESTWAGNIDSTPDQGPVIGEAQELPGFLFATGFSGHGFALGPGAGRVVSELILDEAPSVDVRPYRYSRFAEGDLAPITPRRR